MLLGTAPHSLGVSLAGPSLHQALFVVALGAQDMQVSHGEPCNVCRLEQCDQQQAGITAPTLG